VTTELPWQYWFADPEVQGAWEHYSVWGGTAAYKAAVSESLSGSNSAAEQSDAPPATAPSLSGSNSAAEQSDAPPATAPSSQSGGAAALVPSTITCAGAVESKDKWEWVRKHIEDSDVDVLAMHMRLCEHHLASQKKNPWTGKYGRKCRKGPLCKKLHVDSEVATDAEKTTAVQRFNVPHLSLFQDKDSNVHMRIRPPFDVALLPFYKYFLEVDVDEAPIASITQIEINGEIYIQLVMTCQKKPSSLALSQHMMAAGEHLHYTDKKGCDRKVNVSGKKLPEDDLYMHGTDAKGLRGIMQAFGLEVGTSHPRGIYGFPQTCDMHGYDQGAVVLCEFKGAQVDMGKIQDTIESVPPGMMGFLRWDCARNSHQYVCHPDGVCVKQIRVKMDVLQAIMNEALDQVGYSDLYHQALLELTQKYSGKLKFDRKRLAK